MDLCFRLATALLLLLQAFPLTLLQDTTDSPGRTIDKSWYRAPPNQAAAGQTQGPEDLALNTAGGQEPTEEGQEPEGEGQEPDSNGMSSTVDNMCVSPTSSMSSGEDEENQDVTDEGSSVRTTDMPPPLPDNATSLEANESSTLVALRTEPTTPALPDPAANNSYQDTPHDDDSMLASNLTDETTPNVTASPTFSNASDIEELAPEPPVTDEAPGETAPGTGANSTEGTMISGPTASEGAAPEETAAPGPTRPPHNVTTGTPPGEVNGTVPVTITTTLVPGTTEKSNATDRDAGSEESNTDRGTQL